MLRGRLPILTNVDHVTAAHLGIGKGRDIRFANGHASIQAIT